MSNFFASMYLKVRVVLAAAAVAGVGASLDVLAGWDWTGSLGPWAVPVALAVTWAAAYWKREHDTVVFTPDEGGI